MPKFVQTMHFTPKLTNRAPSFRPTPFHPTGFGPKHFVVCTFSDVLKFDRKYAKKFDFAWGGGGICPRKQNLKRRA